MKPGYPVRWLLLLSLAALFSSCTYREEYIVQEKKLTTGLDSADFSVSIFFGGCLIGSGNGRCYGWLALAFSSSNAGYGQLAFDTVAIKLGDSTHSFIEGAGPLLSPLEVKDERKYKHVYFGEIELSGPADASLAIRGRVVRNDSGSRDISADAMYRIKKETGPAWLE